MIVVSVIDVFGVLGDDFSGLWSSQLGGQSLNRVYFASKFPWGNRSGLN